MKYDLIKHIAENRSLYDSARKDDINGVYLPGALEKKYFERGQRMGMVLGVPLEVAVCRPAHLNCSPALNPQLCGSSRYLMLPER